ncbi:MAG: hypothetical protein K9W44_13780 [Candidatus Lokiarchaeota archaeon]|nr:hypothetical protein [Candidatus Harpocratesius repetitus]
MDKDLPGTGTELKEHFFDESLDGLKYISEIKELFEADEASKYWRIVHNIKTFLDLKTLVWNYWGIKRIKNILSRISKISQDAGAYTDHKIAVNLGGAADYLTQFLQKRLGYSEYLQFIKESKLYSIGSLLSSSQIHE